jgi:hypothetical protein
MQRQKTGHRLNANAQKTYWGNCSLLSKAGSPMFCKVTRSKF